MTRPLQQLEGLTGQGDRWFVCKGLHNMTWDHDKT